MLGQVPHTPSDFSRYLFFLAERSQTHQSDATRNGVSAILNRTKPKGAVVGWRQKQSRQGGKAAKGGKAEGRRQRAEGNPITLIQGL